MKLYLPNGLRIRLDCNIEMTKFALDHLIDAAKHKVVKCREEWYFVRAELLLALWETKETHGSMPDNYWKEECRLRSKYELAVQLLKSLEEIKGEKDEIPR